MNRFYRSFIWGLVGFGVVSSSFAQRNFKDPDVPTTDEEMATVRGNPQAVRAMETRYIAKLKLDAPVAEVERACRILRVIGTKQAIPALAELLADEKLSHFARYALEPMSYPEAGKALRDAVGTASGKTKQGIIHSLGVRKDKQAVNQLVPLLKDTDAEIVRSSACTLGRIGAAEAIRALAGFRASASGKLRSAAWESSLIAAEQLLQAGNRQEAARIYEDLQASKWPKHVQIGAFAGSLQARPELAVSVILEAISGSDAMLRGVSVDNITILKGKGISKQFAAELPKLPHETQVLLIDALATRGDKAVVPEITTAASSSNIYVRAAAVRALTKLGNASSVPVLVRIMTEGKGKVDTQATYGGLRRLAGPGVDQAIIKSMKAAPPAIRAKLITVLSDRRYPGAVGALLTEAASGDAAVRKAAFKALSSLAGPRQAPELIRLLVELQTDAVRPDAERAVTTVLRKIDDESARTDAILGVYKTTTNTAARSSLIRVLKSLGDPKAYEAVRAALQDRNARVQEAALRSLADWPNERPLETLLKVFRTTGNSTHRVVALRGCVRMVSMASTPMKEKLTVGEELMQSAKTANEKKLVLSCLDDVADAGALTLVEPLLSDREVEAEAEQAMLKIAQSIMKQSPDEAEAAAKRLQSSQNESIRKEASKLLNQRKK